MTSCNEVVTPQHGVSYGDVPCRENNLLILTQRSSHYIETVQQLLITFLLVSLPPFLAARPCGPCIISLPHSEFTTHTIRRRIITVVSVSLATESHVERNLVLLILTPFPPFSFLSCNKRSVSLISRTTTLPHSSCVLN